MKVNLRHYNMNFVLGSFRLSEAPENLFGEHEHLLQAELRARGRYAGVVCYKMTDDGLIEYRLDNGVSRFYDYYRKKFITL